MTESVDSSFSSKVSLNMVTNVTRTMIMAIFGLMMVPYYIGEFGLATYAILPLAITITMYFIAISDSLSNAFTRYMVIAIQSGDEQGVNSTFTSSIIGMGKCLTYILPFVIILSVASPFIFNIGPSSALDVQLMFFMIMVSSLMISFSACLGSVFMAYNKLYITYVSRILHCVSQVGFVILFFNITGPSLTLIGISYVIASALLLAVMIHYVRKVCPTIRFSRNLYNPDLLREMGGLGVWAVVAEFGSLMFIQASLVVVNIMLGSREQGTFSIAVNMISMINTVCTSLAAASVPLVYRYYANHDREGMVRTLRIFTKFVGMMMAFPLAFVIIFAPQVIGVWLGPGYDDLYPMLYLLLPVEIAVCTVNALLEVPVVFNRMRIVGIITIMFGMVNVILALVILTLTDWGVLGVCAAWCTSMLMLKLVFYPAFASYLTDGSYRRYVMPLLYSHLVFVVLLVAGYAVTRFFTLPTTWLAVLLSFFVAFLLYFIVIMRFAFNKEETETVVTYLPQFIQRFIRV